MLRSYLFLGVLQATWSMTVFFLFLSANGWTWGAALAGDEPLYRAATGLTLVAVIFTQVANLVGRRSESHSGLDRGLLRNPLIVIGVAFALVFAGAALYWPPLAGVLGTGPPPLAWVALAALGAPLFFAADLLRKRARREAGASPLRPGRHRVPGAGGAAPAP